MYNSVDSILKNITKMINRLDSLIENKNNKGRSLENESDDLKVQAKEEYKEVERALKARDNLKKLVE